MSEVKGDQEAEATQARPQTPQAEDPFYLIAELIAGSGMGPRPAAAFGLYAGLPVMLRSLPNLRRRLASAWGRAPDHRTLEKWSQTYQWTALLARYEACLVKLRVEIDELARRAHSEEVRAEARELRQLAAEEVKRVIEQFRAPLGEPSTWPTNPRSHAPIAPKRSLAGIQGLAYLYKQAVDAERLALGLPTSVTDSKVQADVHTEQTVVLSLEEWRSRTRREREAAEAEALAAGGGGIRPGLPAPGATSRMGTVRDFSRLTEEQLEDFPDEWIEAWQARQRGETWEPDDGRGVIDADPSDPLSAATALEAEDGDEDPA